MAGIGDCSRRCGVRNATISHVHYGYRAGWMWKHSPGAVLCLVGCLVVAGGDSGGGVYVVNGGRFTVVVL